MNDAYTHIRNGGLGFYTEPRGLIVVSGKEAVPFLDGMITNDVKTLADGSAMLAAFPNAQGRLLGVARLLRRGDRFLIETEEATRDKLYQGLFRFTFAGDFFVADVSDDFAYFEIFGSVPVSDGTDERWAGAVTYDLPHGKSCFIPKDESGKFREYLTSENGVAIDGDLYETLRIEAGIPRYGVDMDETTIVPELGLDGMISYTKGCYIGQEIIARIHFRGHVAKQLSGMVSDGPLASGTELTLDGKNAGKIASTAFSPALNKHIALAYVRYDHLAPGTVLSAGEGSVEVTPLPFIQG